jgi:hypothetical protein
MSIFKPGNHLDNTPQQIHTVIGQAAVLDLLLQAEGIGFATFAEQPADIVDDAPTYTLSFRLDQHETTVFRYEVAPHILEQDEQLKNFMSLWEAVHKYAPLRNAAE